MKMSALLLLVLLGGCDDLVGFGGPTAPLATLNVVATGTNDTPDADLRIALVWGTQWLPEPLCILPQSDPAVAAVVAAGCRNPLSFTPDRVAASVPVAPGLPAQIELNQLPSADVMVGDVTARVAYGSLVLFDDRDHDGILSLARAIRLPAEDMRGPDDEPDTNDSNDIVHGASFVAMTEPDQRVAYREGDFRLSGFYPRRSCGEPVPGYSILSAGGFTYDAAVAATLAGELPEEDPATCAEEDSSTLVEIPFRPSSEVSEVACRTRRNDSSVRYREPPQDSPDLSSHAYACTSIPTFGDDHSTDGIVQLVVATRDGDACKGLTHYTLVGCDEGELVCDNYEWDIRATPPAWWPCDTGAQ